MKKWIIDHYIYEGNGDRHQKSRQSFNGLRKARAAFNTIKEDAEGSYFLARIQARQNGTEGIITTDCKGAGYEGDRRPSLHPKAAMRKGGTPRS